MNDPKPINPTSQLQKFSLKTPLLSAGSTTDSLAEGDDLWMHIKVYAEGGENALHSHATEEHSFVVLDGEATFYDSGERTIGVGKYQGMLIPKGTLYRFQSSGDGPLVMLRIGAGCNPFAGGSDDRLDPDGEPFHGADAANKDGAKPGVPIPGRFFGE